MVFVSWLKIIFVISWYKVYLVEINCYKLIGNFDIDCDL